VGISRTELTTNGFMLNDGREKMLIDSGLHYLRVSFYPVTPKSVFENVRRLCDLRDETGVHHPFIYVKSFFRKEYEVLKSELGGVADEIACEEDLLHDWLGSKPQFKRHDLPIIRKRVCPSPFYVLKISTNGDVFPCCLHPIAASPRCNLMGNIYKEDILTIWRGNPAKTIRRQQLLGRRSENVACADCDFIYQHPDDLDSTTRSVDDMV